MVEVSYVAKALAQTEPWGVSVALLVVMACFIIKGVARVFRAQNLLTGQTVTVRQYMAMMLRRV